MCNVYCEPEENIHAFVVGSWLQDIETLQRSELGAVLTLSHDDHNNYQDHGVYPGSSIEVLSIEHAPEGKIPEDQIERGYIHAFLVTVQLLVSLEPSAS